MHCFWAAAAVSPSKHTAHLISDFLYACLCVSPFFKDSFIAPVGSNPTAIQVLACSLGKFILNSASADKQAPQEE